VRKPFFNGAECFPRALKFFMNFCVAS